MLDLDKLKKVYTTYADWCIHVNNKDEYSNLRCGQYLMNMLLPEETNSEIFYEEYPSVAVSKFIEIYCK